MCMASDGMANGRTASEMIDYFRELAADGNADVEVPAGYGSGKRYVFNVDSSDVERFPELAHVERVIIVADAEGNP